MSEHRVSMEINGQAYTDTIEARLTLVDFLRTKVGLTGVHVGCEHGVCGACTVTVDGLAVRSCLLFAVQADGAQVGTVEGLADDDGTLHPVQQAMKEEYGLQCGFCTPGIVMTLAALTAGDARPDAHVLEDAIGGHLCRCTGYQGMLRVARRLGAEDRGISA